MQPMQGVSVRPKNYLFRYFRRPNVYKLNCLHPRLLCLINRSYFQTTLRIRHLKIGFFPFVRQFNRGIESKRGKTANSAKSKRRRTANSAKDMEKPCLPYELIFEILSYLPVVSLLRFKIVCKLWRDTIQDPRFIEQHMKQADLAIVCHGDDNGETPNPDTGTTAESPTILSCLHGLRLEKCNSTQKYSIKNPSTRQVLPLPCPKNFVLIMSMSFISTSHEYKLVYLYLDELTHDRLGCEVLTIGTHDLSWRSIDIPETSSSFDPRLDRLKNCILINGILYIIKDCKDGGSKLICIEIGKEQFVEANIPRNLFSDWDNIWPLRWNSETLSFVNVVKQRLHVWILEDYKKKRWGRNKIDIPLTFLKDFPNLDEDLYIYAFTDDLLLFVIKAKYVILYSIKTARVEYKASVPRGKRMSFINRSTLVSLSGMQPLT